VKKLAIIFIVLFCSTIAFAEDSQTRAKIYLKAGDRLKNLEIDATGFKHGIEMNEPGTAYIINTTVKNAGTDFVTDDGKHGDGIGIIAIGAGSHIHIYNSKSKKNSEDGFRAIDGGRLTIVKSKALQNDKNGFYVGAGSSMELTDSQSYSNRFGFMAANDFLNVELKWNLIHSNKDQGMQLIDGESATIANSIIYDNNSSNVESIDYGGVAIFGVKVVTMTDTSISGNGYTGLLVDTDTSYLDHPVRMTIENSVIKNNGDIGIISRGDSIVHITSSELTGQCLEEPDMHTGEVGIITYNGVTVDPGDCPQ